VDGIALRILDAAAAFPSPRLYRRHLRFQGAVHEDPGCTCVMQTPFVVHHMREESVAERRDKDQRYERMLQAELAAEPNSVHALMYLRDLSFRRKDYPQATAYIERLLQLENDYLCHYDLAIIAAEQRQFAQTVEHGFRALQASCLDPRVYLVIADAYEELGRKVEALVFYDHALHLPDEARLIGTKYAVAEDDFHVVPLVNKAKVLVDLGLKDKALACYDEALRRNPYTPYRPAIERNRAVIQGRR
jgi:tetratricopeptide (TPR) repeat protein